MLTLSFLSIKFLYFFNMILYVLKNIQFHHLYLQMILQWSFGKFFINAVDPDAPLHLAQVIPQLQRVPPLVSQILWFQFPNAMNIFVYT